MRALLALLALLCAAPALAATSPPVEGHAVTARLLAAEDGVGAGVATLSAGLALELEPGWKTYWRSPGTVGLPPALDWAGSANVASVEIAYPAPERFDAFDIENYGYAGAVTYPLAVALERPGEAASLRVAADLLVCAELCVPERVELALDIPASAGEAGGGIDAEAAAHLAEWVARVPDDGAASGLALERVHLGDALTLTATSAVPMTGAAVFPEQGPAAFGPPEITLSEGGTRLWARLPVLAPGEGPLDLTLVSGDRAATLRAEPAATPPPRPDAAADLPRVLVLALLGGLILNLMPCVLPVLSLKLASALSRRDAAPATVRRGFLLTAAGAVGFFVLLAGVAVAARAAGLAVGWGVQFQSPAFLALVIGLVALFAANLFGLFEVALPGRAATAMGRTAAREGAAGDLATGAFAALMATPCSAPFLGTAVTFALTRPALDTVAVFAAMGTGLALPYLLVAARPSLVRLLPRPGAWMVTLRRALGGLMLLAGAWLLTVLAGAAGPRAALVVGAGAVALLAALALRRHPVAVSGAGLAALVALAVLVPPQARAVAAGGPWEPWSEEALAAALAGGETVLVDVTADWCLTCLANERLVLDRGAVADLLGTEVVALKADWTRPDPAIAAFLAAQGRHGIPFVSVHGPAAPEGIVLPELLTERAVLGAVAAAR